MNSEDAIIKTKKLVGDKYSICVNYEIWDHTHRERLQTECVISLISSNETCDQFRGISFDEAYDKTKNFIKQSKKVYKAQEFINI